MDGTEGSFGCVFDVKHVENRNLFIKSEISNIQTNIVIKSRQYYLLIYSLLNWNSSNPCITFNDYVDDILSERKEEIAFLDPYSLQIISNSIREFINDPDKLILSICKTKKHFPHQFFAFSTFPSFFAYFSSLEMCELATLALIKIIESNASDIIVYELVLSYMLSAHSFIDIYWTNFACLLIRMKEMDAILVFNSLVSALKVSIARFPMQISICLSTLRSIRQHLLRKTIQSFLNFSYLVWHKSTPSGLSLPLKEECSTVIKKFNDSSSTFGIFSDIICSQNAKIYIAPSFSLVCELCSECSYISLVDVSLLITIMRNTSAPLGQLQHLENAVFTYEQYRYIGFPIRFFDNQCIHNQRHVRNDVISFFGHSSNKYMNSSFFNEYDRFFTQEISLRNMDSLFQTLNLMIHNSLTHFISKIIEGLFFQVRMCDFDSVLNALLFNYDLANEAVLNSVLNSLRNNNNDKFSEHMQLFSKEMNTSLLSIYSLVHQATQNKIFINIVALLSNNRSFFFGDYYINLTYCYRIVSIFVSHYPCFSIQNLMHFILITMNHETTLQFYIFIKHWVFKSKYSYLFNSQCVQCFVIIVDSIIAKNNQLKDWINY